MLLFDDIQRTDMTRREPDEPLSAYLNRSARPRVAVVRDRLEGWYAHYPAYAKTRGFLGQTDGDFFAKSFELLVHELLMRLDCTILAVEPNVSGNSGKPDFWVEADRMQLYVECTTVNPDDPTLVPMPPLPGEGNEPIGGEVRDALRTRRSLLRKAEKHSSLQMPYVIALTGEFFDYDDLDDQIALFKHPINSLWFQDNKPANQHVNAVWMFHRAVPWNTERMTACLYISPWAKVEEIPITVRTLPHVKVHFNSNQGFSIEHFPGENIAEILRDRMRDMQ